MHLVRIAFCAVGMIMVLWPIYVELFKVGAICLWRTSIHLITFSLSGCVISARRTGSARRGGRPTGLMPNSRASRSFG